MIWDTFAGIYDMAETIYNKEVYTNLGRRVAQEIDEGDVVLECACGTGVISKYIAPKCRLLVATDLSKGMLAEAQKNCDNLNNIKFRYADITNINCRDERFDKVVAGNVIHLLDEPYKAINELMRVCKTGGKVIIPTYINNESSSQQLAADALRLAGVDFKHEFDFESYKEFFREGGYEDTKFDVIRGRMDCAIAVITKKQA
ncbi:MAG: class I SAM-dependent methyltransferase [Ruminococcus sp.]|nr:class I SAM-dependent methyltransferase [Ruminococcus sp.]